MYHYLKWAALSLFFKRNLRYLALIALSIIAIYILDALYEDIADLLAKSGRSEEIAKYLFMKWGAASLFASLIVWSIMRLGLSGSAKKSPTEKKEKEKEKVESDPYLKRLEKFKNSKQLRSKSEILIESRKKRGAGKQS